MQRIVIDTNVLVSGLIQRGYPYLILNNLFIEDKIELCISDEVMKEYFDVLHRKKFAKYPSFILSADRVLADIEKHAKKFIPQNKVKVIKDDSDNKFLDLAVESKANFIITGNTNDFTMAAFKKTKIVTPKEYWENYYSL